MKVINVRFLYLGLFFAAGLLILSQAGCSTTDYKAAMETPNTVTNLDVAPLNVGDTITISLDGPPDPVAPEDKLIKEDGTITLPEIGRIQAAGKTPGQLEDYIHSRYVPAIYTHLNVTVKTSGDRVIFVRGEVHQPGRLVYVGPITVTKAITSAGDFTDFANHKKVYLIRSNGKRYRLNCDKILNGDEPDPPVFPGDQIEVKRRVL